VLESSGEWVGSERLKMSGPVGVSLTECSRGDKLSGLYAGIAQCSELGSEGVEVSPSVDRGGATISEVFAGIAQLVERNLAKVEVTGSSPVARFPVP
jgi:hypothetical protein